MNIERSLEQAIEISVEIASAIAAWFKLLTLDPANSKPTQGATTFTRASAANYFDSAGVLHSAAVNTPRYQDGGLLIEQASTNLALNSAHFFNEGYNFIGVALVNNAGIAPDVTTTAWSAADAIASFNQNNYTVLVDTLTRTVSRYIKGNSGVVYLTCFMNGAGTAVESAYINFATGSTVGTTANAKVEVLPNGWYRLSCSVVNASVTALVTRTVYDGNQAGVMGWGAQVEVGSSATSYIKTLGAPVTRAADICYTATANIPTLANGATFVWKGALPADGVFHNAIRSTPTHTLLRRMPSGAIEAYVGGVFIGAKSNIDKAVHTYAIRTNGSNLHELLIDGVVGATQTATGLLQPTTPLYIGSTNGSSAFLDGSTQAFSTHDKWLTDAEIQGLG